MKLNPRYGIGVAWNDFDRFPKTTTGKETCNVMKLETVCNTVGITCQTITEEETIDEEPDDDENLSSEEKTCFTKEVTKATHETHKKEKRRAYQSSSLDILPYRKKILKLRISDFLFNDNPKRLNFENTSLS